MILIITIVTLFSAVNAGFGRGNYYSAAGDAALREINGNEALSTYSAQSAVASSVSRDYNNQLQTTQQYVNQFTAPVTKSQANNAFNAVRHQQQGSLISAALANAAPGIRRASDNAAKVNFDQAYAQGEGDRLNGAAYDEKARGAVYSEASTLQQQLTQQQAYAHNADVQKTQQTAINAAAIAAISAIRNTDNAASYG